MPFENDGIEIVNIKKVKNRYMNLNKKIKNDLTVISDLKKNSIKIYAQKKI